jgi:hypothetical protein
MRCEFAFTLATALLFTATATFSQQVSVGSKDDAFWVAHWAQPRVFLSAEEESFYKNVKEVMFPWNDHDEPSNPMVKQALVSRGISENRIVVAAGWGQLHPVCPELNDECWTRNRLVRFIYSPN